MNLNVIVVGGGIIGTSTAYYLSKLGADVTLLESKDIASGTSGSCDQAINMQSKKPGPMLELARESAKLYSELEEELGTDLEYKKEGGMILIETEEEFELVQNLVYKQQKAGLDVKLLSGNEAREHQPGLSPNLLGSTWWEHDAKVNSFRVCFGMVKAAKKFGLKLRLGANVTGFITEQNRVVGVEVSGEKIYADAVVVALGIWTPKLLETLNLHLPIIPRRGHILVTEKLPPYIHYNILSGAYMASKSSANKDGVDPKNPAGVGLVMGQTKSGNILIGGSREFVGFDTSTNTEVVRAIGKACVRAFPDLANVRIVRSFAGLRPYTPDGMPVLGPIEDYPGLYVVAGHEGDGIAQAPMSGKLMADVVFGRDPSFDISPFSFNRFKESAVV